MSRREIVVVLSIDYRQKEADSQSSRAQLLTGRYRNKWNVNSSQYKLEWPERPALLPIQDGALCISFCLLKWGVLVIPAGTGMELITVVHYFPLGM